jgi:hypothetical protein
MSVAKLVIDGKNREVFHDSTLKNPFAAFHYIVDGKKKKIILADLSTEKTNMLLKATLKNVKLPPGYKVNPTTGFFIKVGGATNLKLNPKTFTDPISMNIVKKTDGIELNKTFYAKKGLRTWINSGKNTIPHTRRQFTDKEINSIFTNKNGQKILRVMNYRKNDDNESIGFFNYDSNHNNFNQTNNNSNNENTFSEDNSTTWFKSDYARDPHVLSDVADTVANANDIKEIIGNIINYMKHHDLTGINGILFQIANLPGAWVNISALWDGHILTMEVTADNGGEREKFFVKTRDSPRWAEKIQKDVFTRLSTKLTNLTTLGRLPVEEKTKKTFATIDNFVSFVQNLLTYMKEKNISGLKDVDVKITRGSKTLKVSARRFGQVSSQNIRQPTDQFIRLSISSDNNDYETVLKETQASKMVVGTEIKERF